VYRVVKTGSDVKVFVRSVEPAQIGDKLCYDEKTEILTDKGWVPFPELTMQHKVAICDVHGENTKVRFDHPQRIHKYSQNGEMYRAVSDDVSLLVTPFHTVYVRYPGSSSIYDWHVRCINEEYLIADVWTMLLSAKTGHTIEEFAKRWPHLVPHLDDLIFLFAMLIRYGMIRGRDLVITPSGKWYEKLSTALENFGIPYLVRVIDRGKGTCPYKEFTILDVNREFSRVGIGVLTERLIPDYFFYLPYKVLKKFMEHLFTQRRAATIEVEIPVANTLSALAAICAERVLFLEQLDQTVSISLAQGRMKRMSDVTISKDYYTGNVYSCTVRTGFIIVRRNGKIVISGNSGRHGNKGVIGKVLPDEQMPHTADGKPVDLIINPMSMAGRIIIGPTLETALAKVADKEGNQIAVKAFEPDKSKRIVRVTKTIHVKPHTKVVQTKEGPKTIHVQGYSYTRTYDYTEDVAEELKKAGIEDEEELFDPVSGKSLGKVFVGKQYILKLVHQAEKKLSARSGGPGYDYDANMAPAGGGTTGGQRMGELGLYALLAHGSLSLIREGQTYKASADNDEIWTSIQSNEPLPPPKPTFAYSKFLAMLRAMGVKVEKEDDTLRLMPLTDKDVLEMSSGELKNPTGVLRAKDLKPEKGGLFDEEITGGPTGERWCLSGDTVVWTEFGPLTIKFLVNTKFKGRVWSVDTSGKLVLSKVTGWFARKANGAGYLEYTVAGKPHKLRATKNHNVVLENHVKKPISQTDYVLAYSGKLFDISYEREDER